MGGAGAVWGFSEAVGLRTPKTVWFWRPVALIVGAIFFIRWYKQIQDWNKSYEDTEADELTALVLQENEVESCTTA